MIVKHMKRVTFLCPAMTTGGPEAVHQAAQVLNEQGTTSDIAYYGGDGSVAINDGRLTCVPPTENPCLTAYADYRPVVCTSALLRPHHLIVLPEVLAGHRSLFGRATVAIWWLSVDNVFVALDQAAVRSVLTDRSLKHLHQSAYAADFLRSEGVSSSLQLEDFTTTEFTEHEPTGPSSDPAIAYNPAKGADLAKAFFSAHPQMSEVPIQGMSRTDAAATLRRTLLYVDFGHLPGKDRLPREAAASGSVVFLRKLGAGRFHEDFPVPDFFRFAEDDVVSGELFRRITAVQQDPRTFWDQQQALRDAVRSERAGLADQVRALRGRKAPAA
jgi:hypothetical protein